MEETAGQAVSAEQESASMNFFQRLAGAYFEPSKTFRDINLKPSWLVIFLVLAVLVVAFTYFVNTRADMEALTRKTLESLPIKMSEEQINQAAEAQAQRGPVAIIASAIVAPISSLISFLIMAGLFLLVFLMMGAQMKYKKALTITVWGLAPPSIVHQILSVIVLFIKAPGTVDPSEGVVIANLGPLVDAKAHAVLNSIVSSLDLFTIWGIVLLSIGFAAISDKKLTPKKAAGGIVTLWILYILIKAGYRAIIS
jgi:hypothetical protein